MMLSLAAIPGASDLGADGLVLYRWSEHMGDMDIDTFLLPDHAEGMEPVGPAVIAALAPCDGGFMYLWARAFAPTAEEQERRRELARKEEEDARAAHVRQRLDVLWTLVGHNGDCPPLDDLLLRDMRPMLRKIGKPYGGNVRSWEAIVTLSRWAESE